MPLDTMRHEKIKNKADFIDYVYPEVLCVQVNSIFKIYIIYGPYIKSDNKKKLCIWKRVVIWCCVANSSCDIVSVRVHCVDMTYTRRWFKRRSANYKLIKLLMLAGHEPTRITPIDFESIALTTWPQHLFMLFMVISSSTIY